MNDFTALLGSLGRTCQELEQIKLEQVKDHERLSRSFEEALLSILCQEQSILSQVEAEHGRLKKKLTSLHRDNEKALNEGVSEINSMVHQISTISSQLKTLKDSKDNTSVLEEIQEKVKEMFSRKKSILIRLKKVYFTPCLLQAPPLGKITYEEQTFGFSVPYVERRGHRFMSSAETLLSDETPPWEDSPSDTRLLSETIAHSQRDHLNQREIKEDESGKTLNRHHHVPKKLRRENGVGTSKIVSPRKWSEKTKAEVEEAVLSPRSVAKIKICTTNRSVLSTDSSSDLEIEKVNRADLEIPGSSISGKDENMYKQGLETLKHTAEHSPSPTLMQNTGGNQTLQMLADVPSAPERKAPSIREMRNSVNQSSSSPPTHQMFWSPPNLKESSEDCTFVLSEVQENRVEILGEDVTGLSSPYVNKHRTFMVINQEQLPETSQWAQNSRTARWKNDKCVAKSQQYWESEPTKSLATSSPTDINISISGTTDIERYHQLSNSSQDTLFRATAAYVNKDASDNLIDGPESNTGNEEVKDPKTCRAVAIQASRIPSAKQNGNKEQLSKRTSMDSVDKMENFPSENCIQIPAESLICQTARDTMQVFHPSQSWVDASGENRNVLEFQFDHLRRSSENSIHQSCSLSSRSPSPTESIKSSYTFIIESPRNYGSLHEKYKAGSHSHLAKGDLNRRLKRSPPVISSSSESQKKKPQLQTFLRKQLADSPNDAQNGAKRSPKIPVQGRASVSGPQKTVSRSISMPFIEKIPKLKVIPTTACHTQSAKERRSSTSSCRSNPRAFSRSVGNSASISRSVILEQRRRPISAGFQQQPQRVRAFSKSESNLQGSSLNEGEPPYKNHLLGQFCKFGSGRTELNLPHGIHSTPLGSLYVVDYGNRRVQVLDRKGKVLQQITLEPKNYFDVAVNNRGLVALTNSTDRTVEVFSKHGKLLQTVSKNLSAPRGITTNFRDEFVVADMRQGTISAFTLELTTGRQVENTIIPGFNKPYLVSSNNQGLLAVSERGFDGGRCVKVLGDDWTVLRVLGQETSLGPTLFNPWGVCIDSEGNVLVADWGQTHSVIHYPVRGPAYAVVTEGLSSPRGLAILQDCHLVVADSLHNCIKVFWYK